MEINDIAVAVVKNDTEESTVRKSLIAQGGVKACGAVIPQ